MTRPLIFDSHAHYHDSRFKKDRDEVLTRLFATDVCGIVEAATDLESAKKVLAMAEQYPNLYAAVGIYPHETHRAPADAIETLREMAKHKKVVAIGELGLDYHYENAPHDVQKEWLDAQMRLAYECDKPVVFHDRDAHGDSMEAVRRHPNTRGMFHCFSGSAEMAKELVKHGWYVSFTGSVTFEGAVNLQAAAKAVPLSQLLVETDSPYLVPHKPTDVDTARDYKSRNDSSNIIYIADVIADLHGVTREEVLAVTAENARRFFGIQ